MKINSLYEQDFQSIDWENLLLELEDMEKSKFDVRISPLSEYPLEYSFSFYG